MTDEIQKIRKEIEKKLEIMQYQVHRKDAYKELKDVLAYIDSLQEEPKFKTGDRIKPIDSCLGSPRTIVDICDSWYLTDQGTLDFEYEDNWELVEEPVSIWHDMSEEAENGRNTIIIDPKGFYGAVLRKGGSQLKNHNKERYVKWAYIDDIINITNKEEPVSEELGGYINELSKQFPEVSFAKLSRIAVRVAKWQKQQDQSTIELAEDHAMLAGMEKMKEQMMAKAIDVEVKVDAGGYPYIDKTIELYDYDKDVPLAKKGDRYKVVLIKED